MPGDLTVCNSTAAPRTLLLGQRAASDGEILPTEVRPVSNCSTRHRMTSKARCEGSNALDDVARNILQAIRYGRS